MGFLFSKKDVLFPKTLQKRMKMLMNISKSSKLIFWASPLSSIDKIRSKGKAWAKPNDRGLVALTARHSLANPRLLRESVRGSKILLSFILLQLCVAHLKLLEKLGVP